MENGKMCNAHNHSSSCNCGWGQNGWSGNISGGNGGHSSQRNRKYYSQIRTISEFYFSNQCYPTSCPKCGASVFFVRHNGGSVWFDELGHPWKKHGCFDTNNRIGEIRIGQIISIKRISYAYNLVTIKLSKSVIESVLISVTYRSMKVGSIIWF